MLWEFIELPPFTELRDALFSDDEFLSIQEFLCENPDASDVIPGTGGCRKIRWAAKGKGKRGGARVIYFLRTTRDKSCWSQHTAKENETTCPGHG